MANPDRTPDMVADNWLYMMGYEKSNQDRCKILSKQDALETNATILKHRVIQETAFPPNGNRAGKETSQSVTVS